MELEELQYCEKIRQWLADRYGSGADAIWQKTAQIYVSWLAEVPDYGGKNNGHANAIYGGMLVFALYTALPDQPPISELEGFVQNLFMSPFTKLGRVFNLNRSFDMWLIDKVFHRVGKRDRKDNAEFAKRHGLLHVLPLLCNSDFFGISEIHGTLIRCGTCGNSDRCDYCVVGSDNPLAKDYEIVKDELGFLVSRKKAGSKSRMDKTVQKRGKD